MGDAYKMDDVQCTHPRRTRGSSSNTREGIKDTKGRFRKFDRALNTCILRLLTPSSPPRPYSSPSYFLSSVRFTVCLPCLSFYIFYYSLFWPLFLFLSIFIFPSLVYSASALTVSWPDRTSLETTRNCV